MPHRVVVMQVAVLISLHIYKKKKLNNIASIYSANTTAVTLPRTRRNLNDKTRDDLIGYLATSDLLLSLSMPLTASDALTMYWPLGPNTESLAKLSRAVPSAIVYSSSMIIALIAINCYRQILHSSKQQLTPRSVRYILLIIITKLIQCRMFSTLVGLEPEPL